MTINERIIAALDFAGLPVRPGMYEGSKQNYIVFNINVNPDGFADDEPEFDVSFVQVHLFCKYAFDSVKLRKDIKNALQATGFTRPYEVDASDKDGQHFVFECEIAEGVNNED